MIYVLFSMLHPMSRIEIRCFRVEMRSNALGMVRSAKMNATGIKNQFGFAMEFKLEIGYGKMLELLAVNPTFLDVS